MIILVGAGGHALSLLEFATPQVKGYLDPAEPIGFPVPRLGDDSAAAEFAKAGDYFHISYVYSGLPNMSIRRKIIEEYAKIGANFKSLIAPTAIVTPHSSIGEGCAIMSGAIVNRAKLGDHVIINSGAIVEHDCNIGSNTFIGPGTVIGGFTEIGKDCFIGLGAKIKNGVKIGDNIIVAMGAIVNRDLTEAGLYHGNPLHRYDLKHLHNAAIEND